MKMLARLLVALALFASPAYGQEFNIGAVAYTQPAGGGSGGGNVSSSGTPASGQVALWTDISHIQGLATLPAANMPSPTASTLGGIQSTAGASHQWISTISTAGVPGLTRPACADLSDAGAGCSSSGAGLTVGSTVVSSGTSGRILYDNAGVLGEMTNTGTGTVNVLQNTPTLTTPVLGVATATSINGLTITSSTGTLTVTNAKTASFSNTLTFAGTDSSTLNVGAGGTLASAAFVATGTSGATVPLLNGANTWSAGQTFSTSAQFKSIIETFTAPTISSNILTVDLTLGTVFNVSNNANISTFTISNATASQAQAFTLVLAANGSAFTQAWGASVKWPGGTAPTLTTTNAKKDILTFVTNDGGTTWYGFVSGQNF